MPGEILVGTASWSDPEFIRDWYPKSVPARQRLAWYAERFPAVEVNSSFYGIPEVSTTRGWAEQTPERFQFTIKLFKGLSFHSAELKMLPEDVRHLALGPERRVEITPQLQAALIEKTREALAPLADAGKLGAVLLQLSPEFSPRKHRLDELMPLVEGLADLQLAIELRNRNWMTTDIATAVVDWYEENAVAFVNVDAPRAEHFTIMPPSQLVTTDRLAYMRLHGRNPVAYLTGKTVAERFDYKYSTEEIQETVEESRRLAQEAKRVFTIYNNNHSSYAPDAAEEFQRLSGLT